MTEPSERNREGKANDVEFFEKQEDKLRLRIYCAVPIEQRNSLKERMKVSNDPHLSKRGMIRIGGVKAYIDGSIGSHTAAFFDPYCD